MEDDDELRPEAEAGYNGAPRPLLMRNVLTGGYQWRFDAGAGWVVVGHTQEAQFPTDPVDMCNQGMEARADARIAALERGIVNRDFTIATNGARIAGLEDAVRDWKMFYANEVEIWKGSRRALMAEVERLTAANAVLGARVEALQQCLYQEVVGDYRLVDGPPAVDAPGPVAGASAPALPARALAADGEQPGLLVPNGFR